MSQGWATATSRELRRLRRLTVALGDALTVDDVARATLTAALELPGVVRAGIALKQGGGRQLKFVSTDQDAIGPGGVRWCLIDGFADVPIVHATQGGTEVYLQTARELEEQFPDLAPRQRSLGVNSLVALPLATDEEPIGGLMLSYASERYFNRDERWFLSAFATQATQAIRRGVAYQIQHTTSEQLQRSLMPHSLPELPGLSLGAHYQPGGLNVDVGGDWYDVMELADGSVVISLGDVMGKGVPAAIVMSAVRSALRAYALLDPSPSLVLSRLDRLVVSQAVPEQIVTVVYGVVSADRSCLTFAVAGHPPPILIPPTGPAQVLENAVGPALGLGAGPWPTQHLELPPDSTVLLYSDGLVEARDLDLFSGIARLTQHVNRMPRRRRTPRELCARLSEMMYHDGIDDDVTVLAASVTPTRNTRTASVGLPADATASGRARRFLRETLTDWSVDSDIRDTAELCVSELVTNAVIHSGTPPEVTARLDEEFLTVLVQDRGASGSVERAENFDPMSVSGRGLTLIDALSTAWSAEHSADGTTVWFELELAPVAVVAPTR
jgi:serine phosphatase RsbU (regulator of sigma subunit)/anti-sigma regulatory factor (Ser/Thr protein kinase)